MNCGSAHVSYHVTDVRSKLQMTGRLRTAVIGLKQHAGLHIKFLQKNPQVDLTKVYYHKRPPSGTEGLPITSCIEDCLKTDCVVISSPTDRHYEHLQAMMDYSGYILLEKPAVNTKEHIDALLALPNELKERIKINFNFQYHDLGIKLNNIICSGMLGKVFAFDVHSSHGAAFRDEWKKAWRITGGIGLGPVETTGIHYIQFSSRLFGNFRSSKVRTNCLSGKMYAVDTGVVYLESYDGVSIRIRNSYAAPYGIKFEVWGTDGYFLFSNNRGALYYPREVLDKQGYFVKPPLQEKWHINFRKAWNESLEKSQTQFLEFALNGGKYDSHDFDSDVKCMNVLLRGTTPI